MNNKLKFKIMEWGYCKMNQIRNYLNGLTLDTWEINVDFTDKNLSIRAQAHISDFHNRIGN